MRQCAMLLTGLFATVAILGCQGGPQKVEIPQPVSIQARYQGDAPGLKEPTVELIETRKELKALGSDAIAKKADLDFNKQSLVVFALGEKPTGGYWAWIDSLQKEGDTLWVTGRANRPSENQSVSQQITHPYAAVVIPKVDVARVRDDIQSVVAKMPPSMGGRSESDRGDGSSS